MKNISKADIHKYVAGALTYVGFQALIGTAYIIIFTRSDAFTIAISLFPSIGLFLGVSMLIGKERAIYWAPIYLLVYLLLGFGTAVATSFASPGLPKELHLVWQGVTYLIAPVILLALLVWCRSKHFQDEPAA